MTYVAVWKGGKFHAGPRKGEYVFTFLALGRTRREAFNRATLSPRMPARARRANRRNKNVVVVRYGAALLLDEGMARAIGEYTAAQLGTGGATLVGFVARREDGRYWHAGALRKGKSRRANGAWGLRDGATIYPSAPKVPKNANWAWQEVRV